MELRGRAPRWCRRRVHIAAPPQSAAAGSLFRGLSPLEPPCLSIRCTTVPTLTSKSPPWRKVRGNGQQQSLRGSTESVPSLIIHASPTLQATLPSRWRRAASCPKFRLSTAARCDWRHRKGLYPQHAGVVRRAAREGAVVCTPPLLFSFKSGTPPRDKHLDRKNTSGGHRTPCHTS